MPGAANYARVGPKTFPYVIAAVLFVLAVWTAVAALRGEFPEREEQNIAPMVWIVGGLAAQMLLLKRRLLDRHRLAVRRDRARLRPRAAVDDDPGRHRACLRHLDHFRQGAAASLPAGPLERLI